jgi:hypothetical protein
MATDIAELAFAGWQTEEEHTRQKNIVLVRDYYDGDQHVPLTKRQRETLGFVEGGRFAINYCATVVNAVWERLIVAALAASKDKAFSEIAWQWWQHNRMDEKQDGVHRGAVRDGEYFVIVDLDDELQPRFTPHLRYTDPLSGGTGFGCKAHYPDDLTSLPMEFASKRWTETVVEDGKRQTRQRLTMYYPERIEKYRQAARSGESGWTEHLDEGDTTWPIPWVDTVGKPLGIPVIHWRNPDSKSEIWDAIPPQDAINKTAIDILAAADAAGFPIRIAQGFSATTDGKPPASDGGNYLELTPGCWIEIPKDATATLLEGTDLTPLIAALDSWIVKLAQVTDTPISRFQVTRLVAAEGTLKQQEAVLLSKVRVRQVRFGNSWEDTLYMARRLVNTFASGGLNEEAMLEVEWVPAATRDEKEHIETLGLKRDKLNVPLEFLWSEAGYSQEEINKMKMTEEYQARLNMQRQAAAMFGQEPEGEESE